MVTAPNQIYAGTLKDFDDSMAQEIEDALTSLLGPLPAAPGKVVDDRRKLFIAIATGVIRHLERHKAALEITIDSGIDTTTTHINVRN